MTVDQIGSGEFGIVNQLELAESDDHFVFAKSTFQSDAKEARTKILNGLQHHVTRGNGEYILELGFDATGASSFTKTELENSIKKLEEIASEDHIDCTTLSTIENNQGAAARILLRRSPKSAEEILEVRLAVVGNVDSGKSTLLGVLTKGGLDDGRGKARVTLFRYKHEVESGRTSSVGTELLGFDSKSRAVTPSEGVKKLTWEDVAARSAKMISFIDLAGHERYLKTTVFGMTGCNPDFAMLMIAANNGLIGMSKEHLGIALALNVPVMAVITKIDMCPANVLETTVKQLVKILKSQGARKIPAFISSPEDAVSCATQFVSERICPIFQVSNVTGEGLDLLRLFMNILPFNSGNSYRVDEPLHFSVSDTFSVPFVGCVVSGVVNTGEVHVGDSVYLGPHHATDNYLVTSIRSIQRKRVNVLRASAGQSVTFALKRVKRRDVRKGMVIVAKSDHPPKATREFVAESIRPLAMNALMSTVRILFHQSTIKEKYQAMCHIGSVAQTCQILSMDKPLLRTGDRGTVVFRFISRAEHIASGMKIMMREGRTKALGTVKELREK